MKIVNIFNGVQWTNGRIFFMSSSEEHNLLTDYINGVYPLYIQSEIGLIKSFVEKKETLNEAAFEKFICEDREGFSLINGGSYAKIAGSHDLSPSILYDFSHQCISIYHPNTKEMKSHFTATSLINLLSEVYGFSKALPFV